MLARVASRRDDGRPYTARMTAVPPDVAATAGAHALGPADAAIP